MGMSRISRSARILLAATLTLGLGLGAGAAVVTPAGAATESFVATPNGMVGVSQQVLIHAPTLQGQAVSIGFEVGGAGSSLQTTIGSNGYGYISWTPNAAGSWTLTGLGNATVAGTTTVNISSMVTSTEMFTPNVATTNASTTVSVVVSAAGGTIAPAGSVSLTAGSAVPVGTNRLTPIAGSASSMATFDWLPLTQGLLPLVATYTPSSSAMAASTSPTARTLFVGNPETVVFRLPTTFRVGQPTTITAVVTPTNTPGSASFALNNRYLAGSTTLVNGVASAQWTPTASGPQTLRASFTSSNTPTITGVNTQMVNVLSPLPSDNVSISSPSGVWGSAGGVSIQRGTAIPLTTSATSGGQVLLSVAGPCSINGAVLTGLGAGTCTVTASTVGGNGFSAISEEFVVTVTAPPRKPRR